MPLLENSSYIFICLIALERVSQLRVILPSPGDIFGCPNLGDATGIWWVGTQDAAKYPTLQRTDPNFFTEFEEPCSKAGLANCGQWAKFSLLFVFVATETVWLRKPKPFTTWLLQKKIADICIKGI